MKILQIIKEEIVPLSSRQYLILLVIIACVFQFVLFYAPALADEAVAGDNSPSGKYDELLIANDSMAKDVVMNQEAAKLAPQAATSTNALATSTPAKDGKSGQKASSTPALKVIRTSTHVITAYNSEVGQTDDDPCTTANGYNLCQNGKEDTIAANFLKFGTKVKIPELFGDRVFVVRDRMNQKHPARVDVWMKNRHDAIHFGKKTATIQVVE